MSAVAFDNTMLSILLNPKGDVPYHKETTTPVELAKERAMSVVESVQKSRRKIILPAPACAELLTAIGPTAEQYLNLVVRSRIFEIGDFDAKCASELASLNRGIFLHADKKHRLEPYQKRKVDRQIIAICKVYDVSELYTDDSNLASRALLCGITPIGIGEIPIPDKARQGTLNLERHEEIPPSEDAQEVRNT